MTSGSTQEVKAPQKIRAKIGPAENGKGRDCIFSGVVYTLRIALGSRRVQRHERAAVKRRYKNVVRARKDRQAIFSMIGNSEVKADC